VLHQFPFEARVPAGFEVLEELGERDLLARARLAVLLEAASDREGALGRALARAVAVASDKRLSETLDEAVRERRSLAQFFAHFAPDFDAAIAPALGLDLDETTAAVEAAILGGPHLPHAQWPSLAAKLQELGGNAKWRGDTLAAAAAHDETTVAVEEYAGIFVNEDGDTRADSQFGAQAVRDKNPDLFGRIFRERERVLPLLDKRRAAGARARSVALLTLAGAVIGRYEAMKAERGRLDFGDLVGKTADLLSDTAAAWVHYKLDGGIDHLLIDEAQDTSPEQWTVIEKLAEEFFAGRGAGEDRCRTIFAVGDEKQSIFGFQGADATRIHQALFERRFAVS
jgi:ATP-dependent helicase/nuclease subunit A